MNCDHRHPRPDVVPRANADISDTRLLRAACPIATPGLGFLDGTTRHGDIRDMHAAWKTNANCLRYVASLYRSISVGYYTVLYTLCLVANSQLASRNILDQSKLFDLIEIFHLIAFDRKSQGEVK